MVTAEAAVAMPALLVVVVLLLAALGLGVDQVRCVDAAGAAARLAARGDSDPVVLAEARRLAPPGASVSLTASGDRLTVRVSSAVSSGLSRIGVHAAPAATVTARREDAVVGGYP